jgi:hypothetical protein
MEGGASIVALWVEDGDEGVVHHDEVGQVEDTRSYLPR